VTLNKKKLLFFLVFILGLIGFSANYVYMQFSPVDPTNEAPILVEIPKGSSSKAISEILANQQIIKNNWLFPLYAKYTGYANDLKAGKFQFTQSMDLKEVTRQLVVGNTIKESIRFTIPEGFTVEQIADKLASEHVINKEKFLKLINDGDFNYTFVKQIPANKAIKYRLEGYLFPETYEVKKGATEYEIIDKLLAQFKKEWNQDWDKVLKERKMTIHDVVTLASLVEREVSVEEERPIVAGVIYNRLHDNWKLQVDATIQYGLGKQKERLTYKDLELEHPYNTYIVEGLPPGPISNPGRFSIKATLFPEENPYFFYVTKKDHTGEHYFSKTYTEHRRNIAKSKSN